MSKWDTPGLNQGSQLLNRQRPEGAADVGDKQDTRERDFQCPGDGLQQPGFQVGHPASFERLPLRRLDPAQLGGAFDRKAEFSLAAADTAGQQQAQIGGLAGGTGLVLRGGYGLSAHILIAHILIVSRTAPLSKGNAGNYQNMTSAPILPNYLGLPFRILVSPFVNFDPENRVTDIMMFNSRNLGALIVDEDPHVKSWEDGQYNIMNMSIEETYGFGILNEGQAIAVAKNVKIRPNEFVMPARMTACSTD